MKPSGKENLCHAGDVWLGDVWLGDVWLGDVWLGDVWLGDVWLGDVIKNKKRTSGAFKERQKKKPRKKAAGRVFFQILFKKTYAFKIAAAFFHRVFFFCRATLVRF